MNEKFQQALGALQKNKVVTSVGKVTAISEGYCTVEREELPDLTDVRLHATIGDFDNFLAIIPAQDSEVVCLEIEGAPEETCIVKYSEISQVKLVIDGFEVDLSEGKLKIANQSANLKAIIKGLIAELKQAVIQTPAGPGSFSPGNITSFTNLEEKTENLLK